MTIHQMKRKNRAIRGLPNAGDVRGGYVVSSTYGSNVLAVPKELAVKFTLQEWNEMVKKEEVK
jgi:hypothetical protein